MDVGVVKKCAPVYIWLTTFQRNSAGNFLNSWRIFNASSVWITCVARPADDKAGLLATSRDGQSFRENRTAAAGRSTRARRPRSKPARIANGAPASSPP